MKRIYGFDYIRGISAILIVLYHYTVRYFDIYHGCSFDADRVNVWWGCWAVSVFFMMSAYLTVYNLKPNEKPVLFLKKKFIRLYPAYWVGIIFTTVLTLIFDASEFIGVLPTIINFTMFQGVAGIQNVDGVYWTLINELKFYVIVTILIKLRLTSKMEKLNTVWLGIVILYFVLSHFIGGTILLKVISSLFMVQYANVFILGMSVAYIMKNQKSYLSYINIIVAIGIHWYLRSMEYTLVVLGVILLMVLAVKTQFRFKYDKPLVFISSISYPLYLIHQKMGYMIFNKLSIIGVNSAVMIILCIALSVAIAYLMHRFVELPSANYLKRKFIK